MFFSYKVYNRLKLCLWLLLAGMMLSSMGCARARRHLSPFPVPSSNESPSIWPINHSGMRITSQFGEARSGGRRHKGIDIAVPEGTPVMATASGETTFAGWQGAYGNIIIIRHGKGLETAYAHLKKCYARVGKHVCRGDKIGLVGTTGNATGPHLHYEVRQNGIRVNPKPWLP